MNFNTVSITCIIMTLIFSCTSNIDKVACMGTVKQFVAAFMDEKQHGASLMEIKIPRIKRGNKTNIDYFNLGIKEFNTNASSYIIAGTKITLYNNTETNIYSLVLKTTNQDSLFALKFNALKVNNINFIGKGVNGNFYFTVEQETSCNKMYVSPKYAMVFSEY